jgi:AcrR family transcriptional regulator
MPADALATVPMSPTKLRVLRAALERFAVSGFAATTLRTIAADAGIEVGSLYNHISSKQQLLGDLVGAATQHIIDVVGSAVARAPEDPVARLETAIREHVIFYCEHQGQTVVAERELHALDDDNFRRVVALRRTYEDVFVGILEDGAAKGVLRDVDARLTAFVIIGLGPQVARWYRPDGPLSPAKIADHHTDLMLRSLRPDQHPTSTADRPTE